MNEVGAEVWALLNESCAFPARPAKVCREASMDWEQLGTRAGRPDFDRTP